VDVNTSVLGDAVTGSVVHRRVAAVSIMFPKEVSGKMGRQRIHLTISHHQQMPHQRRSINNITTVAP
jgi:hypothetical protein